MTLEAIITCEHGGNRIPNAYRDCFAGEQAVLNSHRGWDAGALPLARKIARSLNARLYYSTTSRLLVDLNRSLGHPRLYSSFVRQLSREERERIVGDYYTSYRTQVTQAIEAAVRAGKTVLHVSVHSFTPLLAEKVRTTDLGLLYDPRRHSEARFVALWKTRMEQQRLNDLTIHRNQPYRGTSDGFTTHLRKQFPDKQYTGIELELSQRWLTTNQRFPQWIETQIAGSLSAAIDAW